MTESIESLFGRATRHLGLFGWRVVWSSDPWCRRCDRTVFVSRLRSVAATAQLLLHELTHASVPNVAGHPPRFWRAFRRLLRDMLHAEPNRFYRRMEADYTGGQGTPAPAHSRMSRSYPAPSVQSSAKLSRVRP